MQGKRINGKVDDTTRHDEDHASEAPATRPTTGLRSGVTLTNVHSRW